MEKMLERTTFETSRLLEFFSAKELVMQIGHNRPLWPAAILKELIDNGLDACETAGLSPRIRVTVEDDALVVRADGHGLPRHTLSRALCYGVRVSDQAH